MRKQRLRRSPPKPPISEVNVLPYIDVMLVLLVIFMVTAPILTQGVDVELPEVTSEPIQTDEQNEPLVVALDAEGNYYLERGADSDDALTLEELIDQVARFKRQNPDLPVLVRGDRRVAYGEVVILMSRLQGAGVTQVGLISKPPEDR
ncbi:Cell division and transport-associated protein TolR (TC 2.C.1.2.1) [Marinospirillum celere]|uniref:Tol-Pal system protein TolR n=1 Tax=Marinospirillum celere TaxID=1122252 RepID=A0A1I1EYW0_9GAMM|nr:protein TolR [Marinospirillum celere]SFB90083.1 Cell division and transport-associated protein TolR (TC 2.C.1.2.1) [Marinospirillum celere]